MFDKNKITNSKIVVLIFRIVCFIVAIFGLLTIIGIFKNNVSPILFLTYTVQSNVVTIAFFGILIVKTIFYKPNEKLKYQYGFFPRISSIISLDIFVTMLVFWLILFPTSLISNHGSDNLKNMFSFGNICVHLLTPLFMICDYLFLNKRGTLKKFDSLYAIIFPYAYLLIVMPLGLTHTVNYSIFGSDSFYPYNFLDVDKIGVWVILIILGLTIFFIGTYIGWQFLDKHLAKRSKIDK